MYTTIKGNVHETITPKLWKGIKKAAYARFDGSDRLFNACWRQYRTWVSSAIDSPNDISDVMTWLDQIASEKVNNSRSSFYLHG